MLWRFVGYIAGTMSVMDEGTVEFEIIEITRVVVAESSGTPVYGCLVIGAVRIIDPYCASAPTPMSGVVFVVTPGDLGTDLLTCESTTPTYWREWVIIVDFPVSGP